MSRWAILVTDRQLLPTISGNRLRILGILAALRSLGWKVALVGIHRIGPADQILRLVDLFVGVEASPFLGGRLERFDVRPFSRTLNRLVCKLRPSMVIAEYVWMAQALARVPICVRRVIDCHDLLHERTQRFSAVGLHPWAFCSREEEMRRLSIGDVIIATQHREAQLLRRLLPGKRVDCILTPISLPIEFQRTSPKGHQVLTLGADHPGNEAVLEFARNVWSNVVERVPDAQLRIVGGISTRVPDLPHIEKLGQVPEVGSHYATASVVVCPVNVGTGIKTKMLEALRFGKAVVVTSMANEGMPILPSRAWVTASTLRQCGDEIVALLNNPTARAILESAAFEFGEKYLADRPFCNQISAVLPNIFMRGLSYLLV